MTGDKGKTCGHLPLKMFWNSLFENWILKLSSVCSVIGEITKASHRSSERVTLYCRFQRNTTIKWGCAVVPVGGQEHTLSLRAFSLRLWIGLHRICSQTDPYLKSADGADSQKELGGVSHLCCQLLFVLLPPASCSCSCLLVVMSMHFSKSVAADFPLNYQSLRMGSYLC